MSSTLAPPVAGARRDAAVAFLREEGTTWLFVARAVLAFFTAGWLAMRLQLPQPGTAMMTTVIVMHRQTGMVLAKSFYRVIGTFAGAAMAILIVSLFPQQRELFLVTMALWIGFCAGGATLYRNFKSYAFVLGGYSAAIIALPVIGNPVGVFDSAVARISEVILGLLVTGVISDTVFPTRLRETLRTTAREQYTHFIDFVRGSTRGAIPREAMEAAHLRFVRDAIALEDLRSSVIFEDAEARARSGHLRMFNQRFMAVSTSFQSLHHLINRLQRGGADNVAQSLIQLYRPLGEALAETDPDLLLARLQACRDAMDDEAVALRTGIADSGQAGDFDTGSALVARFAQELQEYVESRLSLREARLPSTTIEKVRFARGNDLAGAGLAMLRTTLTMLLLSAFWILSAWPMGSSAMLVATIFSGLFATAANPIRLTQRLMSGYLLGMIAGFFCVFLVLTRMDGFALLVAGVLPFFVIGPYLIMRPAWANIGLGYVMGFAYILALNNPMRFDPAHFLNDAISQMVGLGLAALAFVVIPPVIGSRWLQRRQLASLRAQVALAAQAPLPGLRYRFESVNRDLFHQIVAQTAPGTEDSRLLLAWALAVHETGRALIELRHDVADCPLPAVVVGALDQAIYSLALFYRKPDNEGYVRAVDDVAEAIAMAQAAVPTAPSARQVLDHLHLIRIALVDTESVMADYMPTVAAPVSEAQEKPGEIAHAS